MKRRSIAARPDWEATVSSQGLTYHHVAGRPYWNETAFYEFTAREVDNLEQATNELHEMCLAAVQHVIDEDLFARMRISDLAATLVRKTWDAEPPAIYGRFDLAYDGTQIKLLEYNADTPTALVEAAVIQWYWMKDNFPHGDQFNSIHDKLIAKWKELLQYCGSPLFFAGVDDAVHEDLMTLSYLADTAQQAGHTVTLLNMGEIGYDHDSYRFVSPSREPIKSVFKLYPWEWMLAEEFGQYLNQTSVATDWIEPPWKMVLSNKGILPVLWEMYPNHQYLLPAYFEDERPNTLVEYCRKPIFGREGKNVSLHRRSGELSNEGEYGQEGYIRQAIAPIPEFEGSFPVLGSWVIDGESAGVGIRESETPISDNFSRFVPHMF
ncbi:MAG TPA: glutathionylspermidine synthase family protein [Candidatus Bathyarchaeia archaeon]|nr:glutathionylspermidine synthase family protein [Candidatus Bathyarchaeia archaeon]